MCRYLSNPEKTIQYYINDPSTKDLVINVAPPKETRLKIKVKGYKGGGYDPNTAAGQAANCYVTLANCMNYLLSHTEENITKWAKWNQLYVYPRAGKEYNAYYDRKSLKFFYGIDPEYKKYVYTSESADVVSHELGHAILDAMRPDMWNIQNNEIWAFHEGFSDCVAILNILQYEEVIEKAVKLDLKKSNAYSRLAEEVARGLYNSTNGKSGTNMNFMRDMSEVYLYEDPKNLPKKAKSNRLSRDPHSFSRVFSGAFYEMLIEIYLRNVKEGIDKKESLALARDVSCHYLMNAASKAPLNIRMFDAMAKQIHYEDKELGGKYGDIINGVFDARKILKPKIMLLSMGEILPQDKPMSFKEGHNGKMVKVFNPRSMKISNHSVSAMSYQAINPLFNLDIEVANEEAYFFNEDNLLIDYIKSDEQEIIDDAKICLNYLNDEQLVSKKSDVPFAVEKSKLIRTHIYCGCIKDNSCNPEAPEYQKGYKADNNSYCCGRRTPNCNCDQRPITPTRRKLGCYVKTSGQGSTNYRIGQRLSRTYC